MAVIPTPRIDGAQLVALIVETMVYGVFLVLWIQCLHILAKRAEERKEHFFKPLSFTAMFLFLTITSHWLLDCARAFQAFILAQDHFKCDPMFPNAATIIYSHISDPKSVTNSALYVLTTLVGDAFMIYRLFIVWERNWWIIIPPTSFMVALAITGSAVTYNFWHSIPIFAARGWITGSFVLTLLANLSSTSLIAYRIWLSGRSLEQSSYSTAKIVEIIVQSAAIYSCCLIVSLASYLSHSNIQFVGVSINSPMVGIIFCMIILRSNPSASISPGSNVSASYDASGQIQMSRKYGPSARYPIGQNRRELPMAIRIAAEVDEPFHFSGPKSDSNHSLSPPPLGLLEV